MTLETMLSGLSHTEKLAAMDLLWRDLSREPSRYVSPEWHERIIADRLANPSPDQPLPLSEAKAEVKERLEMRVELRVEARTDLVEASAFYDAQRDGLADYFIDCVFQDLQSLDSEAGIHERVYGMHRKLTERFPFAIYYRVADPIVDVVAILDCRRDPDAIARRLGSSP